ncbi:UNVERIFIED_CONTAM: hypothetical protein HDU68_007428 [Siphonaria sp. JEL0065]|nr:hypothetical protein HDU68_007428 [Siphonaria sp. JEL0065]
MDYTEYVLLSAGSHSGVLAHVVRTPVSTPLSKLQPPLTMHRRIPELVHLEADPSLEPAVKNEDSPVDGLQDGVKTDVDIKAEGVPKKTVTMDDIGKIAPSSRTALHHMYAAKAQGGPNKQNYSSKFQKKTRQMFFGATEEGEDPLARAKKRDPDRFPWILRDGSDPSQVLVGSVEVDKASTDRVLFVVAPPTASMGQGFIVTPVTKIHKLTSKPKFHTFTTEEAEEKMLQNGKKGIDRWTTAGGMLKKPKTEEQIAEEIDGMKLTPQERAEIARRLKKLNPNAASGVANAHRVPVPKKTNLAADGMDEDIDFEAVMSDDENPDFGIENEEEAREAKKREYGNKIGRANFEELDEEEIREAVDGIKKKDLPKGVKKLRKALRKHGSQDAYVSDDDETNIYGEVEEDEESDPEPDPAAAAAAAATTAAATTSTSTSKPGTPSLNTTNATGSPNVSNTATPDVSAAAAAAAAAAKLAKQKKKEDIRGYDAESAARKAMYGGVNINALRDVLKTTSSSSAKPIDLKPVTGSPTMNDGTGRGGSASPDLAGGGGTKIKLRMGSNATSGGTPDVVDRKRKSEASPNMDAKKSRTEHQQVPPPAPSAAELLGGGKPKKRAGGSPNLQGGSGNSPTLPSLKKQGGGGSPWINGGSGGGASPPLTATSPRLEELRGGSRKKVPSPNVGTPGLTPAIREATASKSPSVPAGNSENLLTEQDIKSLFTRPNPPKTIKEIVALMKDKMKFEENKTRLGALLKACCKKVKDLDGKTDIWVLKG